MPVTLLYAGLMTLLLLVLSAQIIKVRGAEKISMGDGGNTTLMRRIRAQGNLVEYAPVGLILLAALEASGAGPVLLHVGGGGLFLGRLLHGYALGFTDKNVIGRSGGTVLTYASLAIMAVASIWISLA